MTKLVLIRHGEAAAGEDTDDPELSDRGRLQVAALADRLRGQTFSALRHSPRRRATQTAELLRTGAPLEPTNLLDDRTPVPSIRRQGDYTANQLAWLADVPADERDFNGAALDHAWSQLTTEVTERGSLLAVTHAFVIAWFVRLAMEAPTHRWMGLNPANASLTVVDIRPTGPYLQSFNDVGHLLPEP